MFSAVRLLTAGAFELIVREPRALLQVAQGRQDQVAAVTWMRGRKSSGALSITGV
jgi:hypothetical protein